MPDLASFQGEFARAIRDSSFNPAGFGAAGLSVYRNTCAKGLVDVLRANFPSVERIVGEEWFTACALAFIRGHAPASPVLATYGAEFPAFLQTFEPAAEVPYLADVSQVDALWTQSHFAPDEPSLDPVLLQSLEQARLMETRLRLHASTRMAWFDSPIATLWRLNRPPAPLPGRGGLSVDWRPEGIALGRPHSEVVATPLSASQFAFLQACHAGQTFGEALTAGSRGEAGDIEPSALGELFAAGLFGAPQSIVTERPSS